MARSATLNARSQSRCSQLCRDSNDCTANGTQCLQSSILSPKLKAYFKDIIANDPAVAKAMGEMLPQVDLRVEGVFKLRAAGGGGH